MCWREWVAEYNDYKDTILYKENHWEITINIVSLFINYWRSTRDYAAVEAFHGILPQVFKIATEVTITQICIQATAWLTGFPG
jgi:hypothetical protein